MRKNTPASFVSLVIVTILFGLAIATRHTYNPWLSNLLAGVVGISLSIVLLRGSLRDLLALRRDSALLAAGLGLAMVAATHAGYQAAIWLIPDLRPLVETLYIDIEQTSPPLAIKMSLIAFIVAAEELVWRGLAVALLPKAFSGMRVVLITTVLYALPQLIGGSWILLCAAVAVGTVFGIQRAYYGRITEALITHGIWSVAVFSVIPLV